MKQPYSAESARFRKVMEGLKDLPLFRSQLPPGFDAKRIDPAFLPNTPIEEIELPTRAIKRLPRLGIQTLGDLLARTPAQLTALSHFGPTTLNATRRAIENHLKEMYGANPIPGLEARTLDGMLSAFMKATFPDERWRIVAEKRLGLEDGEPQLLREIGEQLDVTRERIRQLENEIRQIMNKPRVMRLFEPLRRTAVEALEAVGGVEEIGVIAVDLQKRMGWSRVPRARVLLRLMKLWPGFSSLNDKLVVLDNHPCLGCRRALKPLLGMVGQNKDGIPIAKAVAFMQEQCKKLCDRRAGGVRKISLTPAFIHYLVMSDPENKNLFRVHGGRLYTRDQWRLFHGSMDGAVETILRLRRGPVHASELREELPIYGRPLLSSADALRLLAKNDRVVLWGTGTYIHRSMVPDAQHVAEMIERWLVQYLKRDIPCVSICRAYREFDKECRKAGLPTPHALYSILRDANYPRLVMPRYPWIYREGEGSPRPPIEQSISDWLKKAGRPLTPDELQQLCCEEIGILPSHFGVLKWNLPNVERTAEGCFVYKSMPRGRK